MNFAGKAAIITGGAQGIGRAYANALLDIGMKVCICDILEEKALDFIENIPETQKINTIFQKCDVSSLADLRNAFDRVKSEFGRLDIVINNAGVFCEQNYMKEIEINFVWSPCFWPQCTAQLKLVSLDIQKALEPIITIEKPVSK
ncbi:unnamed protein product [Larinioides sclopetarius]|uniref:15-hydroxyprostaglandin dehydrogenase [NAD(+)] n=1 Tax=Larinioides sclopetarius TaxID=280406 RepID=A0AAV2AP75_9ARAC